MNSYEVMNDDVQTKESEQQNKPKLSKEEYARKIRSVLFKKANEQTKIAVSNDTNYLTFLSLQARLGYAMTNTMLVMSQEPNVLLLKDFEHWKDEGVKVNKGAKGIQILEPSGEYKRKDGSIGTNYKPKFVFDISQTNSSLMDLFPHYEINELVKAVTYKTDIDPEIVKENSKLPRDVYFDLAQNKIFIREKQLAEVMLQGLVREYCKAQFYQEGKAPTSFELGTATYLVLAKYGIDMHDVSFSKEVTQYFENDDDKVIKSKLSSIKLVSDKVTERMDRGLYSRQNEKTNRNKKNQER